MKKWILYGIAVVLVVVFAAHQWTSFHWMAERRFAELSTPGKEVVVGICWPFSVNQDGMADGLKLALEEIKAGKLAGEYDIRLVMRDDAFDREKARRISVEFAGTPEMSAVIGYYDDTPAVKASPIYEASSLLHIITGANVTSLTTHGFIYLVRTVLPSNKIARSLARMTQKLGYKKVALLWEQESFGEDLAYQYHVALDNLDIPVVYRWQYTRNRADFRRPVNELRGIDADVVFFSGLEPWAGDFLKNARGVGLKTPVIGVFSDTPEMREHAGEKGLDGAMYFEFYDIDHPSPENKAFVEKFRRRFNRDPDTWAAQGYDALMILAKAVKFTNSRNPLDLSYAIRYMDAWEGANGRYKFTSSGDLEDKTIYLEKYKNGKPVKIMDSGRPERDPKEPYQRRPIPFQAIPQAGQTEAVK